MKKYFLLLIASLSIFNIISAQKKWTLEECVDYAFDKNLQIKSQTLETRISQNQLQSSRLAFLPSINAASSENFTFGRSVDPYTNDFSSENFNSSNFQISTGTVLFQGFQNHYNLKKAESDALASEVQLQRVKNNMSLAIAAAYLNVLFAADLVEMAKLQKNTTIEQLEKIKILVNEGSLPLQNLYDTQAQLANDEYNIVNYENQYKTALLTLAQLIEYEDFLNFDIQKPDLSNIEQQIILPSINEIYQEALHKMPEIKYAGLKVLSADYNYKIARSMLMPRLSLSASYGTGYSSARKMISDIQLSTPFLSGFTVDPNGNILDVYQYSFNYTYQTKPFWDQFKENASAAVMFNLSIPIFNSYQTRTNYKNSEIFLEQYRIQEEQARKDLLKEIQQAYNDFQSALKKMIAAEKSLSAAEINFNFTNKRYEQGLITHADFNISKNNLYRSQIEYIRTKYDYVFKLKILDFYRGIPIRL
jgi:outer membrane protein